MYGDGGSSDAIARDMNSLLHSSTFKHPSESEFAKIKELISSDSYSNYNDHEHNHNHNHNHSRNQNQNQNHQRHDLGGQNESSLMRFRSAPSSFYANLLDESGCDDFFAPSSNHEPEERFFSSHNQHQQPKFRPDSNEFLQYASESTSTKLETKQAGIQKLDLPPVSTAMYGGSSQQAPHLPQCNGNGSYINHTDHNNLESSSTFRAMNSTSTNLIRQSSSPAGFWSSLNAETGMRDVDKGISSSGLNNNHISFSSGPSSPMYLPQIAENRNEKNDSTFRSLKRTRDGDSKMFHNSIKMDTQNGASGHYTPSLVHHMSLPKTSSEMAVAEKFLRFQQDSIPCKTRAKRGCATHPRSIAERVRRTRISERMKKLQELFPTMDKQTSTADMLDLAVQYIKDLQKNLQTLNNARARCTCSSKQLQRGSTS
ncbi:hypothetical protein L6452_30354 [Arctium lappa]|uniref:Uncharacterized protein n=1 Tax=Arctium lappa TaxID=4217 RepID=A0ACB8ZIK2_ARCLA|nr:hypothetical protein L6452_30354 [Arctium lappa]